MITILEHNVQEMIADNDTLIITDPCYIMKDEHWEHWLNLNDQSELGLDDYLRDYHNFGEVIAADTGYGDWCNDVLVDDVPIGRFTADAGMVIVCTASDLTNYGYDKDEFDRLMDLGCLATVPDYTGRVTLSYERMTFGSRLAVITGEGETNFNTQHAED